DPIIRLVGLWAVINELRSAKNLCGRSFSKSAYRNVCFWQILLRKSPIPGVGCLDGVFEALPSIRLDGGSTNWGLALDGDYARHSCASGGGRAVSLARRRRFWATAASVNSSCAPQVRPT